DDKGKQIKAIEKLNERSGMFILSASASNQKAYEIGKYNQGALTYSLLKAIKEQPDILEDRQYLNISRWFNAAEKTVNELARETGTRQQPQLVSTTNFNVGVVDDEVRNKIILPFEKPLFTRSDLRNTDLRIDNLKLRTLIDKKLEEISDNEQNGLILYSPEYDGANIYAISGDYKVTGKEITVSVILTKGGTEIKNQFEIKGTIENGNELARSITAKILEWLNKKE
ncbi:MAG: caspase family protein, partial [Bacteroidota bacterium]|nr:caspase family protein [Bacteroidota bacterium]